MKNLTYSLMAICAVASLFVFSCKKDPDPPTPPPSGTAEFYFKATIDGTLVELKQDVGGYGAGCTGGSGSDSSGTSNQQAGILSSVPPSATKPYALAGVTKHFITDPDTLQIQNMLQIATYGFGARSEIIGGDGINGAFVEYYDGTTLWSTDRGSRNQTGSAFSITSHTYEVALSCHYKTKMTFNCKLYNNAGASKTLTGGEMVAYTGIY